MQFRSIKIASSFILKKFGPCLLLSIATFGFLSACGGGTASKSTPIPAQRNGRSVISIGKQFVDQSPAISADGARITFISGRTGIERVFKSEYVADTAPAAPVRLTTDDSITKELGASLSGNGTWSVISGIKDGKSDLFFAPFSGGALQQLTNDSQVESVGVFSPDSSLFACIKSSAAGSSGQIFIGNIGDGSAVAVQGIGAATDTYSRVFWGTGSFVLYAVGNDTATGKRTLVSFSFANFAASAAATATTVFADFSPDRQSDSLATPVISSGSVYFSQSLSTARSVGEAGTTPKLESKYAVRSEVGVKSLDGASTSTWTGLTFTAVVPLGSSQDAADIFTLSREVIRCAAEEAPTYVGYLAIVAKDGTNPTRIIPRAGATVGTTEVIDDPCARTRADGSAAALDFSMLNAAFSSQSNRTAFRAAAVTFGLDGSGDPEVVLIDRKTDGKTNYFSISQNPKK